ncbi:MAG: hypothetical protein RL536_25 [Candidatus Parcubacteria bacterium]|jgi:hypothetical protein
MKLKTIVITLFVILVIVGLLVLSYTKNGNTIAGVQGIESSGAKSVLTASSTMYDFGTISMMSGNVTKDFIFGNQTDSDVIISGVQTSCMCTSALLVGADGSIKGPFGMPGMGGMTSTNDTIKAGETRILRVIYDPNAHGPAGVGAIDRFVTVTDSTGASLQYEIKAVVTP